jgi:DNA-binding beta-propeller fold protein YncE
MRRPACFAAAAGFVLLLAGVSAQPNPYRRVTDWGQLPSGMKWAAVIGAESGPDGNIYVLHRCFNNSCAGRPEPALFKFDESGKLLKAWGEGLFIFPHGFHVDGAGNIWVSDARAANGKGHQVFKFDSNGKLLMTLGKAGVAGDGPDVFNRPSDVLVAPNGSIFVADGHGGDSNARIVKFDKEGKFVKTWGKKGSGPGEFDTPHGLVLDPQGRLLVADRGNSRIQVFDQDGKFITEWKQWGRPSGIALDRAGTLYAADSESGTPNVNPTVKRGVRIGGLRDGKIRFFAPDPEPTDLPGGGGREGIAVDRDGIVYLAKTGAGGLYRYAKTTGINTTR